MIDPLDILGRPGTLAFFIVMGAMGSSVGLMFLGKKIVDWWYRRAGMGSPMKDVHGD